MSHDKPKTIPIFEVVSVTGGKPPVAGERPIQARGARDIAIEIIETSIDVLSQNMADFIEGVTAMLSAGAKVAGAFDIERVEVQCQIKGGGKVGFMGTGLDLQGGSTMKIIFKRKA